MLASCQAREVQRRRRTKKRPRYQKLLVSSFRSIPQCNTPSRKPVHSIIISDTDHNNLKNRHPSHRQKRLQSNPPSTNRNDHSPAGRRSSAITTQQHGPRKGLYFGRPRNTTLSLWPSLIDLIKNLAALPCAVELSRFSRALKSDTNWLLYSSGLTELYSSPGVNYTEIALPRQPLDHGVLLLPSVFFHG